MHAVCKKNSVAAGTVAHDLCINCGICRFVCPQNAIALKRDWRGEFLPDIAESCTDCGECLRFCPNTREKMCAEAVKISNSPDPQAFGLENSTHCLAWNSNDNERLKSASGGVITKFSKYLLRKDIIQNVIHGERLFAKTGEPHYRACISKSEDEIENRASSIYAPLDLSDVLSEIRKGEKYLLIAVPCVIRAITRMGLCGKKGFITCALVCSHNVSNAFNDYFAEMHRMPSDIEYAINMRNKEDITDANNFNNHFYTKNGSDLIKLNRHKSGWTNMWRSYYFAMNCCNYCSDFWGYEADFSVKDAWGQWACDPLGKSIVVLRDPEIAEIFKKSFDLEHEQLDFETMRNHQSATLIFKQREAKNKNFKSPWKRCNRRNNFLKQRIILKTSKFLYHKFGFDTAKAILETLCAIL